MNASSLARQSDRHKKEAVWSLLIKHGLAAGYKMQILKHVNTWYSTQSVQLIPKMWQDKVATIFDELIPPPKMQLLVRALDLYVEGDDSELRPLIKGRVSVEFGTRVDTYGVGVPSWRSRKFSDPLFLTPAGFLFAYPEADEDLFLDMEQAHAALAFYKAIPNKPVLDKLSYRVSSQVVLGKIGGAGYKRWVNEVKNKAYVEPRRSLAETHAIYTEHGRAGLKGIYSPAYVYALLRKFKAEGLPMFSEDQAQFFH